MRLGNRPVARDFGFDDVICLPEKRQILTQRFERQLLTSHLYFRTETYLGPDRRRMERATEVFNRRVMAISGTNAC